MNSALDREQPGKVASGVMAVLVHLLFFAFLFFGVNWQRRPPEPVMAELWSSLPPVASKPQPAPKLEVKPPPPAPPKVEPPPPPPKPVPKVEVKPAPEPKPVVKPDISLEKEKQEKARRERDEREKLELKKREEAKAELQKREEREKAEIAKREALEKQKLAALERERAAKEEAARREKVQADAVQALQQRLAQEQAAKELDAFKTAISQKVKRFVVNASCAPLGNPEVVLDLKVLPDGNILGEPTVKKSSGSAACDEAVRRASVLAQPLPMPPPGHPLLASFRNFNFNFYPMRD